MHIAIIMDGNGRWASRRHLPRSTGHRAGATAVEKIVEAAARARVGTLTLYAFSAANWQRPPSEVSALMLLLRRHLFLQTQRCLEQSIRLNIIGRRDRLDAGLRHAIDHSEALTAHCSGMKLRVAVDYSSQQSLISVAQRIASEPLIDRARFLRLLAEVDHSQPTPEVDLLIRTGGEQRLSDFLLWECAYAELYFTDCLWPDFDEQALSSALEEYARRERRFGGIAASAAAASNRS
jgi:undecaprenyl diphosphate synthase